MSLSFIKKLQGMSKSKITTQSESTKSSSELDLGMVQMLEISDVEFKIIMIMS